MGIEAADHEVGVHLLDIAIPCYGNYQELPGTVVCSDRVLLFPVMGIPSGPSGCRSMGEYIAIPCYGNFKELYSRAPDHVKHCYSLLWEFCKTSNPTT